jgi:indolepyruvate ferredoxin oxidoreductase
VLRLFRILAAMKPVRGTVADPFRWSHDRRAERALIAEYEADLTAITVPGVDPEAAVALAELPLSIRGFGPVKAEAMVVAAEKRAGLLARLRGEPQAVAAE